MPEAMRVVPPLERLLHLKRIPLLSGLPTPEIAALADVVQERFFAKGEVVFREDAPATASIFVVEGRLANLRHGVQVGTVGPGQGMGGLSVLARAEYGLNVVADEDTLVLELDADAIADVLEDRLAVLQHLLREVSRQALVLLQRHKLDPSTVFPMPPGDMPGSAQLDLVDRLLLLRRMPVFNRTSITALAELARTMAQVRFEAGTPLWHVGEPAAHLVMICDGSVRATVPGGVDFTAGPGFPLGALEALGQRPRWYDVVATTPVVGLYGQTDVLVDLFEDNFDMAMDYLAVISRVTLRILDWSAEQAAQTLDG
ncbi:MAG TPA: cyclic nucleotide-binding domain-containing protein [Myxococcota bacterium]|nr:cyclic nucleotide-binding domain-containing protein [Myxococcota bacterium]